MKEKNISRLRLVSFFIVLVVIALVSRLYYIQIIYGDEFSDRADRQYTRPSQNLFDRGSIFLKDKDGRLISGAGIKTGFTVALNPSILENASSTYQALQPILTIDKEMFFKRAGKSEDPYEEIAHHISIDVAEKIQELDITGLRVYKDQWRYYPGNSLASQTLGFVAFDGDVLTGVYGMERYYNDILNREGDNLYVNFFAVVFANLNKTIFSQANERAGDIVTSLEPSVQLYLESKLRETLSKWNPRLTAGIIINPQD